MINYATKTGFIPFCSQIKVLEINRDRGFQYNLFPTVNLGKFVFLRVAVWFDLFHLYEKGRDMLSVQEIDIQNSFSFSSISPHGKDVELNTIKKPFWSIFMIFQFDAFSCIFYTRSIERPQKRVYCSCSKYFLM